MLLLLKTTDDCSRNLMTSFELTKERAVEKRRKRRRRRRRRGKKTKLCSLLDITPTPMRLPTQKNLKEKQFNDDSTHFLSFCLSPYFSMLFSYSSLSLSIVERFPAKKKIYLIFLLFSLFLCLSVFLDDDVDDLVRRK